jgi:[protein-PII] uridylyltransferase
MVRYFYKYDLEDPKVIESFAAFVGSEQRLRYLYVHTYCDANGTAPDLWNQHKDDLHHQLFSNTLQVLRGKSVERDPATLRKSYANLELEDLSSSQIAEQLEQFPNRYFAHVGEEEVALHVSMASRFLIEGEQESNGSEPMSVVEWRDDVRRSLTIVHIVTRDQKGLFEKLAGSFAIAGLNILGSRAFTRSDNIAIDVFFVEKDEGAAKMKDEDVRTIFENTLKEVLAGEISTEALIRERRRKLDTRAPFSHQDRLGANIAPNVDVYRDALVDRTIVEVRAADQLGLLHLIAKAIADCGLSIAFARIATEHGVANDVFHVESADPEETFLPSRYLELRERLGQDLSAGKYHMEV